MPGIAGVDDPRALLNGRPDEIQPVRLSLVLEGGCEAVERAGHRLAVAGRAVIDAGYLPAELLGPFTHASHIRDRGVDVVRGSGDGAGNPDPVSHGPQFTTPAARSLRRARHGALSPEVDLAHRFYSSPSQDQAAIGCTGPHSRSATRQATGPSRCTTRLADTFLRAAVTGSRSDTSTETVFKACAIS